MQRKSRGATLEPYLSAKDVSAYLGVPVQTLYQWRWKGIGPKGSRVGRHLRYRREDVDAWIDQQSKASAA